MTDDNSVILVDTNDNDASNDSDVVRQLLMSSCRRL